MGAVGFLGGGEWYDGQHHVVYMRSTAEMYEVSRYSHVMMQSTSGLVGTARRAIFPVLASEKKKIFSYSYSARGYLGRCLLPPLRESTRPSPLSGTWPPAVFFFFFFLHFSASRIKTTGGFPVSNGTS